MPTRREMLDQFKLLTAAAILEKIDLATIRCRSLSMLDSWNMHGIWTSAHDEWRALMSAGTDEAVIAAMTGLNQRSARLRDSSPYVGLIGQEQRRKLLKLVGLM